MKRKSFLYVPFFLFCITLLGVNACRDKENGGLANPSVITIPQEAFDYCYFKPGTWWAYRDSVSGDLDTIYVTEARRGFDSSYFKSYGGRKPVYEWFTYTEFSTSFPFKNVYTLHTSFSNCDNMPCHKIIRSKSEPGKAYGEGIYFFYKIQVGFSSFASYSATTERINIVDFIDTFTHNNNVYYGVAIINITKDKSEDNSATNFYHAKNVGVIRREIINKNQVWQLIAHNIIQ